MKKILGFSNRWYSEAIATAEKQMLPAGMIIRMVAAPWFLATKLEAFYGRGNGDYMASHDLEDFIAILDGRETIVSEVQQSGEVGCHLAREFGALLSLNAFHDALPCHLPGDALSQQRVAVVIERMTAIRDAF